MSKIVQQWYVEVSGKVYGPYNAEQMRNFVAEGRIIAQSHISHDPEEGFYTAQAYPIFKRWQQFEPGPLVSPQNESYGQRVGRAEPEQAIDEAIFMIMAEINSGQAMKFLHALQKLGTAQRIGDTVWILRARARARQLNDHLSQTLQRQDRLFIVDSFNNEIAWHNIGADMDSRIRELWVQT